MLNKLKIKILEELEDTREGLNLNSPFSMSRKFSVGMIIISLAISGLLFINLVFFPAVTPTWISTIGGSLVLFIIILSFWIIVSNFVLLFFKHPFLISTGVLRKHIKKTVLLKKDMFMDEIKQKFSHDVVKMHFYSIGGRLGFRRTTEYSIDGNMMDCFWISEQGNVAIEVEEDVRIGENKKSILKILNHSKRTNTKMGIYVTLMREDKIKHLLQNLKDELKFDEISSFPFPLLVIFPIGRRDFIANFNEDKSVKFMK